MAKIKVTSMVPHKVGLIIPEFRFSRNFTGVGQTILIEEEILKEGMYSKGVSNLFRNGTLKIEDKDMRIELGLEVPASSQQVITLNPTQMKALLIAKPFKEFKEEIEKLSKEQLNLLVEIAAENKITDYEKNKLLKEKTGKDVLKMVTLNED